MINTVLSDCRRELWHLPLEYCPGLLWRMVARIQPCTAGGDHHRMARRNGIAQRCANHVPVGHHDRTRHRETKIIKSRHDDGPRLVRVDAGSCTSRDSDHESAVDHEPSSRDQSPRRPPDLVSTRTSLITAARSMALIMSITASPATATAVSASISTPVRSVVLTVAVISTPSSINSAATSTPLMNS